MNRTSDNGSAPAPGLVASLRTLADALVGSAHDRLELFGLEVQEEKLRLMQSFLWISAAVFAGVMALTFASLALVYVFWESARLAVLGGLALFYGASFIGVAVGFKRWRERQPRPFAASLHELEDDRACIRNRN